MGTNWDMLLLCIDLCQQSLVYKVCHCSALFCVNNYTRYATPRWFSKLGFGAKHEHLKVAPVGNLLAAWKLVRRSLGQW